MSDRRTSACTRRFAPHCVQLVALGRAAPRPAGYAQRTANSMNARLCRQFGLMALAVCSACSWMENNSRFYATIDDLKAASAGDRSWAPGFLPPSSHDIHIAYNVDTNEIWGQFSFDATDQGFLRARCEPSTRHSSIPWPRKPYSAAWWPADMTRDGTVPRSSQVFQCPSAGTARPFGHRSDTYMTFEGATTAYFWE